MSIREEFPEWSDEEVEFLQDALDNPPPSKEEIISGLYKNYWKAGPTTKEGRIIKAMIQSAIRDIHQAHIERMEIRKRLDDLMKGDL